MYHSKGSLKIVEEFGTNNRYFIDYKRQLRPLSNHPSRPQRTAAMSPDSPMLRCALTAAISDGIDAGFVLELARGLAT